MAHFPLFAPPRKEQPYKIRRIIIDIPTVHNEIDQATFRRSDAAYGDQSARFRNAVSSDSTEKLDGLVVRRLTDYRDADVRRKLAWCIIRTQAVVAGNIPQYKDAYVYEMKLPLDFNDEMLGVVATKIDEYLVKGSLKGWYDECGVDCPAYDLDGMLEDISSTLRGSRVRMPLQPFGPAYKTSGDDFFYKAFLKQNPVSDGAVTDDERDVEGLFLRPHFERKASGGIPTPSDSSVPEDFKNIIRGEDVSIKVNIDADGFDIDIDEWRVDFMINGKTVESRTNADVRKSQNIRYVSANTSSWPLGEVFARFTLYVPDPVQPDGTRLEMSKIRTHWRIVDDN